jgi:hypothetical protein
MHSPERYPQTQTHSHNQPAASLLSWVPLLAGLSFTVGEVAYRYGIALYFLNYRHGFVKRGLIGELFLPITHFSRSGLITLQVAFTLLAFAATYALMRRLLFGDPCDRVLAAVLFAAPALLPHIATVFEQPDVTLYLLSLAALAVFLHLQPTAAAFASTAIACVALLVHEAFSLAFYPLILAILWDRCRRQRLSWMLALLQVTVVSLTFLAILHFGTLKVSPNTILAEAAQRTSVPLQRQVFDVMASNYAAQRALVISFYRARDFQQLCLATSLLSIPYFYMLVSLLRRAVQSLGYKLPDLLFFLALFTLPLSLCWLGHDVSRWISDCAIDATLFLVYLTLTEPAARRALAAWAAGPQPLLWLAWELITGPYDATALLAARRLSLFWPGH